MSSVCLRVRKLLARRVFILLRNRIVSARMERMAFADSFEPEPKAIEHTMLPKGINAIVRTAGVEQTALPQPGTDHFLIQPNRQDSRFYR